MKTFHARGWLELARLVRAYACVRACARAYVPYRVYCIVLYCIVVVDRVRVRVRVRDPILVQP